MWTVLSSYPPPLPNALKGKRSISERTPKEYLVWTTNYNFDFHFLTISCKIGLFHQRWSAFSYAFPWDESALPWLQWTTPAYLSRLTLNVTSWDSVSEFSTSVVIDKETRHIIVIELFPRLLSLCVSASRLRIGFYIAWCLPGAVPCPQWGGRHCWIDCWIAECEPCRGALLGPAFFPGEL